MEAKDKMDALRDATLEQVQESSQMDVQATLHVDSIRVEQAKRIREQLQLDQKAQMEILNQMQQEQEILNALNRDINENFERLESAKEYNENFRRDINRQIFALHGVSGDKEQGIREYKNAYYQGGMFISFLISLILIGTCFVVHGPGENISLILLAMTGVESVLFTQEKKRGKVLDAICKFMSVLILPIMIILFVMYELQMQEYSFAMEVVEIAFVVLLFIGTFSYFIFDPYKEDKRKLHQAKEHIREIEKNAAKEIKNNQKKRMKLEKKNSARYKRSQVWKEFKQKVKNFVGNKIFRKREKRKESSTELVNNEENTQVTGVESVTNDSSNENERTETETNSGAAEEGCAKDTSEQGSAETEA